jgi:glycine cleavage system transcriptional repressor
MKEGLILAAIGRDRPGIVDRISGAIFQHGCNLEDSRMVTLGGEFALMVLVGGPEDRLGDVKRSLGEICSELDLTVQFRQTRIDPAAPEKQERLPYKLTAVSMDHPGIVHKITHLLAGHGVNVANLETRLGHAPVSGTPIFSMEIEAELPAKLPIGRLREALKELSEAENMDIDIRAIY